ncbi:U3 small nucleolar RNA-associated protein 25 homolog [Anopheles nili]|uniref:U3 small nucleolar RNA-associated protein 25 homolog n=1 Tax=Anopheles nili TaxID=185578 RepID=UPI00237A6BC3|nr:U3 small nucleolar RNA-associated protein 25 homolog [Anopheles nili]
MKKSRLKVQLASPSPSTQQSLKTRKPQIETELCYRKQANSMFLPVASDSEDEGVGEINEIENLIQHFRLQPNPPVHDSGEETGPDEEEMVENIEYGGEDVRVEDVADNHVQQVDVWDTTNIEMNDEPVADSNMFNSDDESMEQARQSDREIESDASSENDENVDRINDPYMVHTALKLSPAMLEAIAAEPKSIKMTTVSFGSLGTLCFELPTQPNEPVVPQIGSKEQYAKPGELPVRIIAQKGPVDWAALFVKEKIARNIPQNIDALQRDLFTVLNNYQDLYYSRRTHENASQLRFGYCLHALNHVFKAVSKEQNHTVKLAASKTAKYPKRSTLLSSAEYRDQGYVRPKVLIVVPFRESALQIVKTLAQLFARDNPKAVSNYKRFIDEYGGVSSSRFPHHNRKPLDYERTFAGNIDDNFHLGIAVNRSTMKLYAEYYSSDVIVASPLGLRMAIDGNGERHGDFDFLANIEQLIIDQAEVCYAQNWEHIQYVMEHMHKQLTTTEHTDMSRVREWCLNGWSKFYRQTVLVSGLDLPEIRAMYNGQFANYRGKAHAFGFVTNGTIRNVKVQVHQSFQRIDTSQFESEGHARFSHFINLILPQVRSMPIARCLIYVPSYFDFVRLRNHFKQEEISFTQICEHTSEENIAQALDMFHHGSKHFLLYSERAHFFQRNRIKGIRQLIMYGPPVFPNFYPEIVNLMSEENQNRMYDAANGYMTVTVLYTGFNMQHLAAILGTKCAQTIMKAPESVYRFSTDLN